MVIADAVIAVVGVIHNSIRPGVQHILRQRLGHKRIPAADVKVCRTKQMQDLVGIYGGAVVGFLPRIGIIEIKTAEFIQVITAILQIMQNGVGSPLHRQKDQVANACRAVLLLDEFHIHLCGQGVHIVIERCAGGGIFRQTGFVGGKGAQIVFAGHVYVGGVDVRDYDLEILRNSVAMVLQKNELFSGTIAENLRWGNKDATDAEIEEACKQACADEFIERFPDKYNTHIDQGGTNVSGGQKQRLCIARALLKKPRILILDDSTSAVDTGTDAKIRKSFAEKIPGTTVFIIAQRISSVENADHVIVLDNGRISGYGTPAEMLATNPIYQEVYNSQTKGSGDFDEKGGDNNG